MTTTRKAVHHLKHTTKKWWSVISLVRVNMKLPLISLGGMLLIVIMFLVLLPEKQMTIGFTTIDDLKAYAASHEEFPTMDNTNIIKPDFTTFYKKGIHGYWKRKFDSLLERLHLKKMPVWTVDVFVALLKRQLELREKEGLTGDYIYKVRPQTASQFVIFGDVQAAYHSLVRDVERLIEIGILSKELKIVRPDCFIIFMGNVIDRAAYSMETMTIVMRLVEENPKNVFYLRGNHENNDYWHDYGLKQELIMRLPSVAPDKNKIPLGETVSKYFNTLASAIYVSVLPHTETEFVRVSREVNEEESSLKLDEGKYNEFLEKPIAQPEFISLYNLKQQKEQPTNSKVTLRAIVKSEKKRRTFQSMDGIRLLSPEKGVTAWTVLSCPTTVYQKGIKFYYDAFGLLCCATKIEDWTIALHSQDVRTKVGFKTKIFNLLTGQESAAEIQKVSATAAPDATPAPTIQPTPPAPVSSAPAAPQAQSATVPEAPVAAPAAVTPAVTIPVVTSPPAVTPAPTPQTVVPAAPPAQQAAAPTVQPVGAQPVAPIQTIPVAQPVSAPAPTVVPAPQVPQLPQATTPAGVAPTVSTPAPAPQTPTPAPVQPLQQPAVPAPTGATPPQVQAQPAVPVVLAQSVQPAPAMAAPEQAKPAPPPQQPPVAAPIQAPHPSKTP